MNKSTPIKFQFKTQSYVKGVPVNITVTPENLLKYWETTEGIKRV